MTGILAIDGDGNERVFPNATRFQTDDMNNLCLYEGPNADQLFHVFASGWWREAMIDDHD